ncbi:MAG: acetylglutamate kinase [Acidimicrobiia bacterium]|nr:acetylglutamate kinase [Acidimicrobiia bacterium]NNF69193.1 acetylglutamate kinase [Acidimicrobiia bacterium]NNK91481.1 acetylglutamate kinase [Acidimicrobiia bacterium]
MSTGHSSPNPVKTRIATGMGKARILSEALDFIKQYRGSTVVIKYGGSAMVDPTLRNTFADDVALLHYVGMKPVIVHGGGPHINSALAERGIETTWIDGLRVTDADTLRVVQSTLIGELNPDIVRLVNAHGAVAAGINGLDGNLFAATQRDERLGFVGSITTVNPTLVKDLQSQGYVPVVAPLARGEQGQTFNVNADAAAAALATSIGAAKLVFLTDVEGLYHDLGDADSLISQMVLKELEAFIESGSASSGMIPKLEAAVDALEGGVDRVHVLDGRVQHAVLLEIFTPEGIGTMVTRGSAS